jgi:hypothetical protein
VISTGSEVKVEPSGPGTTAISVTDPSPRNSTTASHVPCSDAATRARTMPDPWFRTSTSAPGSALPSTVSAPGAYTSPDTGESICGRGTAEVAVAKGRKVTAGEGTTAIPACVLLTVGENVAVGIGVTVGSTGLGVRVLVAVGVGVKVGGGVKLAVEVVVGVAVGVGVTVGGTGLGVRVLVVVAVGVKVGGGVKLAVEVVVGVAVEVGVAVFEGTTATTAVV